MEIICVAQLNWITFQVVVFLSLFLQMDIYIHSIYRFQFSIYLGNGEFAQNGENKTLFNGVAEYIERKDHLLLTFDISDFCNLSNVPSGRNVDELYIPLFCRVAQRATLSYRGKFNHRDFTSSFTEIEPIDSNILDNIFDDFSISLIGCDPHTQYESEGNDK